MNDEWYRLHPDDLPGQLVWDPRYIVTLMNRNGVYIVLYKHPNDVYEYWLTRDLHSRLSGISVKKPKNELILDLAKKVPGHYFIGHIARA